MTTASDLGQLPLLPSWKIDTSLEWNLTRNITILLVKESANNPINIKYQITMNEKTKKIISYVLSVLIVGGATTYLVIDPNNFLDVFLCAILPIIILAFLGLLVAVIADMLYEFFSSSYFDEIYRKYKSKHERH